MVLGQDEQLTEDVREDFKRSGLAHVLAVSGQNVMLLAMLVLAAGAVAGVALRVRLALALAWSPSTCRSPAPGRRSSARESWARPVSSRRSPAARRTAGTRSGSPRRSRSR